MMAICFVAAGAAVTFLILGYCAGMIDCGRQIEIATRTLILPQQKGKAR